MPYTHLEDPGEPCLRRCPSPHLNCKGRTKEARGEGSAACWRGFRCQMTSIGGSLGNMAPPSPYRG